jgi:hypothetical protein
MHFDLDNPDRGAMTLGGGEGVPGDFTHVCRDDVAMETLTKLIPWRRPVDVPPGFTDARDGGLPYAPR